MKTNLKQANLSFFKLSPQDLNKLATSQQKTLRNNQPSFIAKKLPKAIMTSPRSRNRFFKTKS